MCARCWQSHPDRPFCQAERLAARLEAAPSWFEDFVAHVTARHCVGRACVLISGLGRLLTDAGPTHPQILLERARLPGRSMGSLARCMEGFFVAEGFAVPLDQAARLAARRRQRRIDGAPEPLRGALARFATSRLQARERARRARTRPTADRTIEKHLGIVRDFARFLFTERTKDDWAAVEVGDVEAFLATSPTSARHRLFSLRAFFRWARANKILLVDPTKKLAPPPHTGLVGRALTRAEQKALLRRWSSANGIHPHERLVGTLALLHGASCEELRSLRVHDIDWHRRRIYLCGRSRAIPLDPVSSAALEAALAHRQALRTLNPFVIVTKTTRTGDRPASGPYLTHVLDSAGVSPKRLRTTRLLELVTNLDVKVVAEVFGLSEQSVLVYLADHVDDGRLADL